MLKWPYKDPDEVLDYQVDWTARLNGDTITSSVFIPQFTTNDLVIDTQIVAGNTATIWLSGGTLNQNYVFVNRITTDGGRTMDQSISIQIKGK